jgi:hypothetical protein
VKVIRLAIILTFFVLAACGKKKPDPAQQLRAFMADWERAVDAKNPAILDSLLTSVENAPPIEAQKLLAEIYVSEGIAQVNLVGRQLNIGEKQAVITGRLVRSGISDSLATLNLTLIRTKKGWKLAAYQLRPFEPVRQDTATTEPPI